MREDSLFHNRMTYQWGEGRGGGGEGREGGERRREGERGGEGEERER